MKKISFKNLNCLGIEKMSNKELKIVTGGNSSPCQSSLDCPPNDSCDGGYCSGSDNDPNPKITACLGKSEFDSCSWKNSAGYPYAGKCRYRFASPLYCSDTIFV